MMMIIIIFRVGFVHREKVHSKVRGNQGRMISWYCPEKFLPRGKNHTRVVDWTEFPEIFALRQTGIAPKAPKEQTT